ncbi:hypothetical protein Q9233_017309 [Columba guinea]|nr:hypothetical protein Q9233_017309 [Columba guinea]
MSAAERGPGGGPGGGPAGGPVGGRKARGRPRLTESDRARRRLESRKKYDVRRVYLGEAHGPWVDLRRRSGWSDAKLAAYLLGLERGQRAGRRGKPWEQIPKMPKRKKRRRRNVNCLRHAALWYQDHRGRCPAEPRLAELEPALGLSSTAVWQCERGHRYFQDLHPPRAQSDSDSDSGGDSVIPPEEQQEVPGLKQEEPPVPTVEPPPEPPQDPLPEEDGLTIVYEIPREPLRRRSRRGRPPPPPSAGLPEPIGDAPPPKRGRFRSSCQASGRSLQLRRQMLVDSGTREFPCNTCGKAFRRKNHLDVHRRTHNGETPVE